MKKRRVKSSSQTPTSESNTPKGVVRKLLKPRRPCRSSKKTVAKQQDAETDTSTCEDGVTRLPVSSATKLKLAAFSANDTAVSVQSLLLQ